MNNTEDACPVLSSSYIPFLSFYNSTTVVTKLQGSSGSSYGLEQTPISEHNSLKYIWDALQKYVLWWYCHKPWPHRKNHCIVDKLTYMSNFTHELFRAVELIDGGCCQITFQCGTMAPIYVITANFRNGNWAIYESTSALAPSSRFACQSLGIHCSNSSRPWFSKPSEMRV